MMKRPDFSTDRFSADPERSYTMPARIYHDPEFHSAEQREIFHRSWLFVGHVSELAEPGAYLTHEICGQRVFVIRATDGGLKGFFNVCQHRGHSLLRGKGTARGPIVCPYHAWSYDSDGKLLAARNCDLVAEYEKAEFDLPAVAVDTFAGFVFVNLDPEARPMAELYPGAEARLRELRPRVDALHPDGDAPFDIAGNWKNVGDNLLECYHCSASHRDFVSLVDMDTYEVETHDLWSIQWGRCRPRNTAFEFDAGTGDERFSTLYLWPTVAFVAFPGTEGVSAFSFRPTGPETTHQDFVYYRPGPEMTPTERAALDYFKHVLGPEDVGLVEDVQIGLHSLGYHQGRIMVDRARSPISEHALHHFQALVMREMAAHI